MDWQRPITAEQLQAEMIVWRSIRNSPRCCVNFFAALGNDPFVIAECLARPVLTSDCLNLPCRLTIQVRRRPANSSLLRRVDYLAWLPPSSDSDNIEGPRLVER